MKKWTVVIELAMPDDTEPISQAEVNSRVSDSLADRGFNFQIMETIPAPYGPQHPGGVFIAEMRCICRKGSSFVNPNCKATVHHP